MIAPEVMAPRHPRRRLWIIALAASLIMLTAHRWATSVAERRDIEFDRIGQDNEARFEFEQQYKLYHRTVEP